MAKYTGLKLRALLVPLGAGVVVVFLCIAVGSIIWNKISPLTSEISLVKSDSGLLEQRLATLTEVNPEVLELGEAAYLALPAQNPGILVVSQLKQLATEFNVVVTSLSVGSVVVEGEEISRATLDFKLEGTYNSLMSLITRLKDVAPLVNIEAIKIVNRGVTQDLYEASGTLRSYWSGFPEKLPALTETLPGLTEEELNILSELSVLDAPTFSTLLPVSSTSARTNPFKVE